MEVWRDAELSFATWYMVRLNQYFMCAWIECVFFNLGNKEFSIAVTGDLNPRCLISNQTAIITLFSGRKSLCSLLQVVGTQYLFWDIFTWSQTTSSLPSLLGLSISIWPFTQMRLLLCVPRSVMPVARTCRHIWPLTSGPCSPTFWLLACCSLVNRSAPRDCLGPESSLLLSLLANYFRSALNLVLCPLFAFPSLKSGHIHLDHGSHPVTSYLFNYC